MVDWTRRRFLQASALAGGAMLLPGVMQAAWAAGSDKPEQETVRIGFIPLTDCAPIAIAALKGFDKKYGITIVPTKEASWAAVRDKLVAGELDAAHILYGLLYGLELGIAGKPQPMANLMTLNHNGQAITLSNDLLEKGMRYDGLYTAPGTDKSLSFPGSLGGMNWGSLSTDPVHGFIFVNDMRLGLWVQMVPQQKDAKASSGGEALNTGMGAVPLKDRKSVV